MADSLSKATARVKLALRRAWFDIVDTIAGR